MRIFFLIRSLERGGAERQLIELAKGFSAAGATVAVCTFYDGGALRGELEQAPGITVLSLGKRSRFDVSRVLIRLQRAVRKFRPDVIHGYMAFANELALMMGRMFRVGVAWGLRSSEVDPSIHEDFSKREFAVAAQLSGFTDAIIVNSEAGRRHHQRFGYCAERMVVVPNGIDCDRFKPDREARNRVRNEWGVLPSERLVALIARINPVKDQKTFVRAAARVVSQQPRARFACIGYGTEAEVDELKETANQLKLGDRMLFTGARDDMSAIYNAIDVLALSSISEGFPNVVAEAMASGKPCVVTDVGDAAHIVRNLGIVVPPRSPEALADGVLRLVVTEDAELARLGSLARERIVRDYSIAKLVEATDEVLRRVAQRTRH